MKVFEFCLLWFVDFSRVQWSEARFIKRFREPREITVEEFVIEPGDEVLSHKRSPSAPTTTLL